jgi:septal ring factor EnvC (AmiA/AmiB activator)
LLAFAAAVAQDSASVAEPTERLQSLHAEIAKMQRELDALRGRERGVLGELERLDAELRLRETEAREAAVRLEKVESVIEGHDVNLARLDAAQAERRAYLAFRLREIYKAGESRMLQRVLAGDESESYWDGLSYASFLSERDARVLEAFHGDAANTAREREALEATRLELAEVHAELASRRDTVAAARANRAAVLLRIRRDEGERRVALAELQEAAEELTRLAAALQDAADRETLEVRRFQGLLDWPAEGELSAGFGTMVHPEFGTRVPHPGWDISAPFGGSVLAVFDGEVVFADWMRGYGLTAIVDHGDGVLSVYAHASMLMVQAGERVVRRQTLGKVGDTGSLRGAYLYFELRVDGKPVDPVNWLRRP